ncbi:leucine-rich repeat serine/threonine-protein kinase 2 isoform X1 [Alligator mississippiensis]|uniref:leucine-rich repeat serine/threonine-protein kinase 2 isoform X1 n=2 Tax=Alligator mississippiensis TaxID=8496 RepID=UPI002877A462|nr:leucine-rich repeat serine/threonine-protein kinase 2 isoform X1 [Alligator mississippiensis]XP_019342985.2 leucine-rich repeat serine/threonine-protein kinase 2 isoform X1 [Alligator mississippiensis]
MAEPRDEAALAKLLVRLRHVRDGQRLDTLVQTLRDLLALAALPDAPALFRGRAAHVPLLVVLDSYVSAAELQQVGWSLLCKLIEVCPATLPNIVPHDVGKDWEVLGVHQQILKMLKIHKGNENLSTTGLKVLNLLLTSDAITFLLLEEETDVFLLVLDAMNIFPKNEEIQQYGCKALHRLFEKVPEEQLTEFVESKDHMIILNVLKQFQEKEDLILLALYSLHSLAGPSSNVEVLMSGNVRCYNIIVEIMKRFSNSEPIQEVSCCLFHKLTLGNFFNILVLNEVHEVIVKAVIRYSANAKLQAAALGCLALLTETIFLNQDLEERKEEVEEEKICWLEACYKALKLHRRNIDVQEAACWALNNLLMYQCKLHEKIGDEDKQYPAHREVMLAMLMHSTSKEVFQAAANTLATLSKQNVSIRKVLLAKGIHMNVLDIMKKYSHAPEVAESACKILNHVFEGSFLHLDVMTVTASEVVKAMRKHEQLPSVQLEAFRVLLHFMVTGTVQEQPNTPFRAVGGADLDLTLKVIKNQCLLEGTHTLVLDALNRFIGNPAIQRCGLKILSSVAECSGALEILSQQGATDTILHTLQMYPDDQEIQCLGLSLLGSLITRKSLCIATMHVLATVLVSTLRRFNEVTEIQMHGFRTVLTILDLSPCFAKLLIHESFDTVIFYQMSMFFTEQRNQQCQSLCCKCFAKLADSDDIKNAMLEKACTECNNSIMAECLLLLGADANKKTKTNSLIYQVCERGSNSKLVELLLNSGAREQDVRSALTISIKKGDSQIISLLLRKLSLDIANSSICLGGYGIGKIEPSWLIPLFPDKPAPLRKQTNAGSALARMVLGYQMKSFSEYKSRSYSDVTFCDDPLDKSYDWTFLPDPLVDNVFHLSDDLDSEESESSFCMKKKSNSIAVADLYRDTALQRYSPTLQRHSNSVGPGSDYEPHVKQRKKLLSSEESLKGISKLSSSARQSDSLSSLSLEKEYIKSLDLSSNELENIDAISQNSCLTSRLEHLEKLELHQNTISSIPEQLCETLKCLTCLDLHSNRFTSFPTYLLKISCIANLDISRNDIGPFITLDPNIKCPSLKQFNLSYNQLSSIPELLADVVEKLEQLMMEGNKISSICSPIFLKELKVLNISKNNISSLAEHFIKDCTKLEIFSARMNLLDTIPDLSSGITSLNLSQNHFIDIPDAILLLPHLRSVDLSNNKIINLPGPVHWKSLNLRELLFNHNQISILDLNEKASMWSRLEKLHLSHNRLTEIPPQIGFLENLTSLDVSYNPDLSSFPDEMGKLSKIWDLPLDGLNLNLDFKHVGFKAKDIIRFLQQRLKKSVPYNRMKLMIVGNTGSGKTTLLQQLMKCKRSDMGAQKATVGIDVKDWTVQMKGRVKKELILNVWDFAGQEEFYSTHPHFMTQRALYLAVYDLSKGQAEVDAMKPWLFNIKARASSSPVILVGTHLDVSDERQCKTCMNKITGELLNQRGFPLIQDYHFVNATEESDSIIKLRKTIIKESLNFKIRDQPVVGQLIPDSYLELEKRILFERKNVQSEFPVIDQKRLLELVQESQLQLDENELPHAIHFLNESGVLLHFQDPALQLRDLYFVDPKWLCKIMAQILTMKVEGISKYPKGIIKRSDVETFLLKKSRFPKIYMSQYFKLLEKFQIALPLGEDQLLIPSSLSDHRPVIELPHCENSEIIIRLYEMPYFPMGFWSRLINRLLEVSPYMLSGRERALRPNRMYWRQGIYLNWSPEAYCLVESAVFDNNPDSFLKITVPSCRKGCILLGQVVDHIDSLMEEWFPGLLDIDVCGEGETLLKKWALYSFEDGEEHQKILLDDLLNKAEEGDLLVSPDQPKCTIPIAQIAPDLVLTDLPRNIMLNNDELEFDQAPEFLLGDGGFGSVYRASYGGEEVAVKIFNKHTSLRLLRQELVVLCHLHHPSLVSLLAAAIRPRMLVMELALKGSLDRLLQQDNATLTRTLQHRIALHVADGLRYLHSAMIIYRDLKPHNVLLFTLYPNAAVIAKIADYGIAQYCCRMGIKTSEGTPGFRAPEVARGNVIYNQQADVYSFGLLLYDILTAGGRIMEGMKFPNEFDELAIQGKLPDPVKEYGCAPWPEVENLIKKCLKENPQERPTSVQIYEILNSAKLICLMRYISIPHVSTAECIVAANQSCKNAVVWIGSGNRENAQLSIINLNTDGHMLENIADSRILSLALVTLPTEKENWIVAGTQSGSLWAVSTEDEKNRHCLQKMSDSVTCLYCNSLSKQSKQKNFFLVGTADGKLAVFEDKAVKHKGAAPVKTLTIGNVNTPLMCLSESTCSSEKNIIWGGCGTKIISLSNDFSVQKLIETKTSQLFCHKDYSDANIISIAVDKSIYLAKKNSHFVEVWDKKTEKLCELIDCALFLKETVVKLNNESKHRVAYSGRVKTICLQKNTALWIGTGGGHIVLLDLSTRRPIQIIQNCCDSVRVMLTAQLGSLKNVVLVLGYCYKGNEDNKYPKEVQSCLSVWDINLPHEVQNLKKHIEMRQELAQKMRSFSLD